MEKHRLFKEDEALVKKKYFEEDVYNEITMKEMSLSEKANFQEWKNKPLGKINSIEKWRDITEDSEFILLETNLEQEGDNEIIFVLKKIMLKFEEKKRREFQDFLTDKQFEAFQKLVSGDFTLAESSTYDVILILDILHILVGFGILTSFVPCHYDQEGKLDLTLILTAPTLLVYEWNGKFDFGLYPNEEDSDVINFAKLIHHEINFNKETFDAVPFKLYFEEQNWPIVHYSLILDILIYFGLIKKISFTTFQKCDLFSREIIYVFKDDTTEYRVVPNKNSKVIKKQRIDNDLKLDEEYSHLSSQNSKSKYMDIIDTESRIFNEVHLVGKNIDDSIIQDKKSQQITFSSPQELGKKIEKILYLEKEILKTFNDHGTVSYSSFCNLRLGLEHSMFNFYKRHIKKFLQTLLGLGVITQDFLKKKKKKYIWNGELKCLHKDASFKSGRKKHEIITSLIMKKIEQKKEFTVSFFSEESVIFSPLRVSMILRHLVLLHLITPQIRFGSEYYKVTIPPFLKLDLSFIIP
jgi:hypothetical protein